MKRIGSATTLLGACAALAAAVTMVVPVWKGIAAQPGRRIDECAAKLRDCALAVRNYVLRHEGRMPRVPLSELGIEAHCPVTGMEYVFVPGDMQADFEERYGERAVTEFHAMREGEDWGSTPVFMCPDHWDESNVVSTLVSPRGRVVPGVAEGEQLRFLSVNLSGETDYRPLHNDFTQRMAEWNDRNRPGGAE